MNKNTDYEQHKKLQEDLRKTHEVLFERFGPYLFNHDKETPEFIAKCNTFAEQIKKGTNDKPPADLLKTLI